MSHTIPIIAFFTMSFLIGIYSLGFIGGKIRNYYVAGNIIPFWVIVLSLAGQAIEVGGTSDNGMLTMTGTFWSGAFTPIGVGTSLLFIGLFYAKPLHKMKLLTLADFFLKRYDKKVEGLVSIICVFSFMIMIASNIVGAGMIIHYFTGLNENYTRITIAIIVMTYTMAGGLFAVTWNDVLHLGIIIIGFSAALIFILNDLNPDKVLAAKAIISEKTNWNFFTDFENDALKHWGMFFTLALGDIVAIDFMERVFAAKSPKAARFSCILSGILTIVIGALIGIIGMLASLEAIGANSTDNPFLWYIKNHLPHGIGVIVIIGLIAACIGTIDGAIMACTAVISKNLLQPNFPKLMTKKHLLLICRLTAIPVTVGALIIGFKIHDPLALLLFAFDLVFATCLIPLTLGIYWKGSTAKGALWSIIIAFTIRCALEFIFRQDSEFTKSWQGLQILIPPVISLISFVIISIATNKKEDEKDVATA